VSKFAIVGGAGFIGSHFINQLANSGHEIVCIDNYCSGSESRIAAHLGKEYFNLVISDAEDTERITHALRDVETVIHLASNPDIAKAATYPRIDFTQGTQLTESVLEASRLARVRNFLYASGSGVYASSGLEPISEDTLLQPISTYGASKLAGEALLSAYSYMFEMKCLAFRFANVVGPNQTHGVGYDFVKNLKNNPEQLNVLGNGTQTKSYIHVFDVVQGVLHAFQKTSIMYDVYNVATEDFLTVKEIANMTIELMKLADTRINYGDSDRGWKADVPMILLDSSKLRKLGWQNTFNSYAAMQDAINSMI
jgi:UDP-glucose 4-epimerase